MPKFASPDEMAKMELAQAEEAERDFHQRVEGARQETERELFRFASSASEQEAERMEPEDSGDRSLEEPDEDIAGGIPDEEEEQQVESEDDEQQDGGEDEEEQAPDDEEPASDQSQRDERSERSVPSYRLREQSERVQALERELADLRMRMQPPQQPQQPPQKPDMFVDPDGHTNWVLQQNNQQSVNAYKAMTLQDAKEQYGEDFTYVEQTLMNGVQRGDPAAQQALQGILGAANPGRALMRWGENLLQDRVDQREEDHRQWYRDTYGREPPAPRPMRSGQGESRQSVPPRRGMPSLNSAGGNGRVMNRPRQNAGYDDSDEGVFNYAFDDIRR